jgi:hypothetical protein
MNATRIHTREPLAQRLTTLHTSKQAAAKIVGIVVGCSRKKFLIGLHRIGSRPQPRFKSACFKDSFAGSPMTTKGAQTRACASSSVVAALRRSNVASRIISPWERLGLSFEISNRLVISSAVASSLTSQFDTTSDLPPASTCRPRSVLWPSGASYSANGTGRRSSPDLRNLKRRHGHTSLHSRYFSSRRPRLRTTKACR